MSQEDRPPESTSSSGRKPIIKIDNFVRKQAGTVDVETLNRKGVRKISVLTYSKINDLISLAVLRAFEKYGRASLPPAPPGPEAEGLRENAAEPSVAREKEELEDRTRGLEEDVEKLRPMVESRIEELRNEEAGPDPVLIAIRDEGMSEMEGRVRGAVARFMEEERAKPSGAGEDLEQFERNVHAVVDRVLAAESARMLETLERVSSQKTRLLQRRLEKLQANLKEVETSLRTLAEAKAEDPGIPSIYRTIQGLNLDDNLFEKKRKMLQVIFEENLILQKAVGNEPAN
jgi:hypothetical protein